MKRKHIETDYEKERKRSDHRLRPVSKEKHSRPAPDDKEHKQPGLEGYEPSERECRQQKAPREQLLVRGGQQRISAGYNKDNKLTMVFSRDKNDGAVKDQETLKKERSSAMKQDKKYLRSGIHNPKKSAIMLEDRDEKRKKFLMGRLMGAVETPGDMLLDESFSFISSREEIEEIRSLEEEARAGSLDRELVERNRNQASALYQDLIYKEQERRDLMKKLNSQVTPENAGKKGGGFIPVLASAILSALAVGGEGGVEDDKEEGGREEGIREEDGRVEDDRVQDGGAEAGENRPGDGRQKKAPPEQEIAEGGR